METKKRSQIKEIWIRLRKNKMAVMAMIVILLLICCAIFADFISDYKISAIGQDIMNRLQSPSTEHWFGTDEYGRDIFARVIFGTRISLSIGVISTLISISFGVVIGSIAGFYGGRVDNIIMRINDILMATPGILLCIAIVAALGTSFVNLIIAIAIAYVPGYVRVVKSAVLQVKGNEYVEAAKALGARSTHIIFKHLVLNSMAPIIVQTTLGISSIIITAAALSYLGLGTQPPVPEWGSMLSAGKDFMRSDPYMMFFPGLFIFITSLSFNIFGDGLRDAMDPKLKN